MGQCLSTTEIILQHIKCQERPGLCVHYCVCVLQSSMQGLLKWYACQWLLKFFLCACVTLCVYIYMDTYVCVCMCVCFQARQQDRCIPTPLVAGERRGDSTLPWIPSSACVSFDQVRQTAQPCSESQDPQLRNGAYFNAFYFIYSCRHINTSVLFVASVLLGICMQLLRTLAAWPSGSGQLVSPTRSPGSFSPWNQCRLSLCSVAIGAHMHRHTNTPPHTHTRLLLPVAPQKHPNWASIIICP